MRLRTWLEMAIVLGAVALGLAHSEAWLAGTVRRPSAGSATGQPAGRTPSTRHPSADATRPGAPASDAGIARPADGAGPSAGLTAHRPPSSADEPPSSSRAGSDDHARSPRLTPAELDRARPEQIRSELARAVEETRARRALAIAPEVLALAAEEGSVRVVFAARADDDPDVLARTLDSGGAASSVEDLRVFPLLGHGAAKLSPGALLNLITETSTSQIELDAPHTPSLLQSVPQIGADLAHQSADDGDGFAVAVIDTGVDVDHPMFASRLIEEACFSVGNDCPNGSSQMLGAGAAAPCAFPGCDHGTHVAGIAVGDTSPNPLVGVAPHAELIAINVFSDMDGEAVAYTSDILAAMQHVLALSAFHDVAAVNLSLGGEAYNSSQSCNQASPSQVNAIAQLRSARIATVAAAGNDGFTNAVSTPACLSNAISVGSVDDADGASSFSNSSEFLDLLAPGETIVSAANGGGTRVASGTSMATPHVTGAIAAIREAVPDATVDEIENALVLSGLPILDERNDVTTPRIRVDQAIALLEAAPPGSGGGGGGDPLASQSGGGGGGGCGLVGLEPFLVLALVRLGRRGRRRPDQG
ncbi:MAG: S8 family serine peptidase [Deltaproteobacteria bacterium]|nr:S8 family serine peptidase [Deltaproteobacteria bacterium]